MASGQWSGVLGQVQRLFQGGGVAGLTEGQLLDRFVAGRDQVAFEGLVARHGAMVLGVCRGVLDDPHDVEDAFQATFLVLVRKAAGLRDRDLLAPWLYGVARKVALRARSDASRRKARERSGARGGSVATFDVELREIQATVREEVARLPAKERMAVVLCYLEGLTHEEAAVRLGWPVGTVKGRLARARDRLRLRLVRRGITLPAAAMASTLAGGASAAVPANLIAATVLAATRLAAGPMMAAGIASAHAVALMEGVIQTMVMTKLKIGAVAFVATCALAVPGVVAWQGGSGDSPASKAAPQAKPQPKEAATAKSSSAPDSPDGSRAAWAALIQQARQAFQIIDQLKAMGETAPPDAYSTWSRRLLDAQLGLATSHPEKIAALKEYVERSMKEREEAVARSKKIPGRALDLLEAEYRGNEALKWLAEAQAQTPAPARSVPSETEKASPKTVIRAGGGRTQTLYNPAPTPYNPAPTPADDRRNKAINAKLEERISMNFPNDTPFEDVKKYIEQSTQDEAAGLPIGIPIYIDPKALKQVNKTMASTITINVEGVPLRTTLRLILDQIDLVYKVEDGLLIITRGPVAGFQ
jgi:RNA polymerase sigma factor (sigma-70 family)